MALLQVNNLNKFYGATPILQGASLEIQAGEKLGLIGRNGCGKTTLLRILTGECDYDGGAIHWAQDTKIGYLRQEPEFQENRSIYQELRGIFGSLDQLELQINEIQERLKVSDLSEAALDILIAEQHRLQEEYEHGGGYQITGRIQGVLRGLGIPQERWEQPATAFSGGERTRLALARLLLSEYDILLLDEPTNYLDLDAIEWLEKFLSTFKGAILLISHDRFFLDQVVTGIYEIENGRLYRYRGNYSTYRIKKEADHQTAMKAYLVQAKEIARQEEFIREARATEKSKRKAHSMEKRLTKVERVARPVADSATLKLSFRVQQPSSRLVLELEELSKGFNGKALFQGVNIKVEAGEKIALIGANGAGKTTLLRLILGLEGPDRGRIRLGYEVYPGYFAQLDQGNDLEGTPFSQIMASADLDNTEARTLLGRFLFQGDAVFKQVSELSGGERRRLGLLKLMLSKANLLILDEPTNHLDLGAIEVLEQALADYEGTVLVVSHDRYFLNRVTTRYIAIADQRTSSFTTYQAFLEWREKTNAAPEVGPAVRSEAQARREQTKDQQRELRRRQRQLEATEAEIAELEARKAELIIRLNDSTVSADYKSSTELSKEFSAIEERLNHLYQEWEKVQLEIGETSVG